MGAYQHTKPNGHTIPEMNRVTVQWERVIVYRESCDSRLLQSKRPFFGLFWPDVPPTPHRLGLCSTRADEEQQRRTCWKTKVSGATLSGTGDVRVIVTVMKEALRQDEMLHAFMFTLSGIPVLYSGDEILQENEYSYHDDPEKQEDNRYLHRGKMDWKKAAKRTGKTSTEDRMFSTIRQMEKIRGDDSVFDSEADTWLPGTGNDHVLALGCYYRGEQLIVLFNFSDRPQTVMLRDEKLHTDLMTGEESDTYAVRLEGGDFRWLLHTFTDQEERL